ncbi:MAG TPA: pilus assembly protein TadG-related protein [Candidatus Tumulicola sp.]|jgi:hypothetical protein
MKSRSGERGQVLPLVAICLAVLMGFAALAVDVGYEQYQQRAQQSATDAAAIAGARQLVYAGCPSQGAAQTAARNDAATDGYTNGTGTVSVTVNNGLGVTGPYAADNCAVQVTIFSPHTTFFAAAFAKFFGTNLTGQETTQAVATLTASDAGCVYMLDPTQTWNANGTNVNAATCSILINGTANFNGGTIRASAIGYGGSTPNENGASFPQATPAPMLKVADPCPQIAGCAYLAANAPTIPNTNPPSPCSPGTLSSSFHGGALPPGCYNSPSFNGDSTVTMNGNYTLINPNFNGVNTITMTNGNYLVTSPNFNGAHNISMTSGNYTLSDQDFNGAGNVTMSGGTFYMEGSTNFNGATVAMSGYFVYTGSMNANGATLKDDATGNGTTMYTTTGGSPNFNGATVKLSPPSTGNTAGVLYYQVPANSGNPNFNGASNALSGLFYAPGADGVNFNGANGGYTILVFGSANFNGSSSNNFGPPPGGVSLIKRAVLAQ